VPPGEHRIFTWDDVEPGIWFDPEFLKKYEKAAEPVTIGARQAATVKVRIAPPE
jgi:hypothetical protein